MIRRAPCWAASICVLLLTTAGGREKPGSHPDPDRVKDGFENNLISMKVSEVPLRDVASMFSRLHRGMADGFVCSPASKERPVTVELKDASVGAALDSICADYNLFRHIEPEAGFIFTVAESTNSRQQIKAGLLKNRPAWPELPPSLVQWIVNDKAHDAGTGRAVHTRYVDGGAFTWRIEQQGTALAVVPHQARILKE